MEHAGMKEVHQQKSLISSQRISDTPSEQHLSLCPKVKRFFREINMTLLPSKGHQAVRVSHQDVASSLVKIKKKN